MKFEKLFAKLFLIQLSLIFSFFVFEMGFRFYDSLEEEEGIFDVLALELVPRPYVSIVTNPEIPAMNSLGYPGELPSKEKKEGELRIFMLGGSTVFGDDPYYVQSYPLPKMIEELLQKKYGKRIKVFNFGVAGSVTNQDLMRLVNDVVSFAPNLVIAYGGGNDIHMHHRRVGYPHSYNLFEVNPLLAKDTSKYNVLPLIFLESQMVRKLFRNQLQEHFWSTGKHYYFGARDIPFYESHVGNYLESLRRMDKVSHTFGSKFLSFFQPMKAYYFEGVLEAKETQSFRERVLASPKDFSFIDLSLALKGEPETSWRDFIHIYDEPRGKLAALIVQEIEKSLNL